MTAADRYQMLQVHWQSDDLVRRRTSLVRPSQTIEMILLAAAATGAAAYDANTQNGRVGDKAKRAYHKREGRGTGTKGSEGAGGTGCRPRSPSPEALRFAFRLPTPIYPQWRCREGAEVAWLDGARWTAAWSVGLRGMAITRGCTHARTAGTRERGIIGYARAEAAGERTTDGRGRMISVRRSYRWV
jgi:hypothetical protein